MSDTHTHADSQVSPDAEYNPRRRLPPGPNTLVLLAIGLIIISAVAFVQVLGNDFITYDDNVYVTENQAVQDGLTWNLVVWAFTTFHAANWHPLTWLSHAVDCQIFGLNPLGHHLTNLLLHLANVLLLFLILNRMTGSIWRSASVAALFGVHPLRVESVAWVAERKDVLSTFFWMLTTIAYVRYTERPGTRRYLAVAFLFALGLLSKPMLVTLPFTLLLLDYWPLGRLSDVNRVAALWQLIKEKIPLFVMALLSSVVTYIAQRHGGAVTEFEVAPLSTRIANALVSYVRYLGEMIWPADLAVLYPHPAESLPMWQPILAGLFLLIISFLLLRVVRRPFAMVGWLWYLGTLIPTIGIIQVGAQSHADRYTYVPLIGVFMIIAWGVPDLVLAIRPRSAGERRVLSLAVLAVGVVLALCVRTWFQVKVWKDDITLYSHTLRVTQGNYLIHNNLGVALTKLGKPDQAIEHFKAALEIAPDHADTHMNYGKALVELGDLKGAESQYQIAIRLAPDQPKAYNNIGTILEREGRVEEAVRYYRKALGMNPRLVEVRLNLARALLALGKAREAHKEFARAAKMAPRDPFVHLQLASAYSDAGRIDDAVREYETALKINPHLFQAHTDFGLLLIDLGRIDEAADHFSASLKINPNDHWAHYGMGLVYARRNKATQAAEEFEKAVVLEPDMILARYQLGLALLAQGKAREAKSAFSAIIEDQPYFGPAYAGLGMVAERQGKLDEAAGHYRHAIQLGAGSEAYASLAGLLTRQGKWKEAVSVLRESVRVLPGIPALHYNLAFALERTGDTDGAIRHYSSAVKLDPTYARAHKNLAVALYMKGRYAEAWKHARLSEKYGGTLHPDFIAALRKKMPEPAN